MAGTKEIKPFSDHRDGMRALMWQLVKTQQGTATLAELGGTRYT